MCMCNQHSWQSYIQPPPLEDLWEARMSTEKIANTELVKVFSRGNYYSAAEQTNKTTVSNNNMPTHRRTH